MIVFGAVVLLLSSCHAMPMDNATETASEMLGMAETNKTETGERRIMTMDETGSEAPTEAPTGETTESLTDAPTEAPTEAPVESPPEAPPETPTEAPTAAPSEATPGAPTEAPGATTGAPPGAPSAASLEATTGNTTEASPGPPTEAPAEPSLTTQAPPLSPPDDDPNCPGHRAVADNNTMFQKYHLGAWIDYTCPENLIWFQDRCWCDWRPATGPQTPPNDDPDCPGHRAVPDNNKIFQKYHLGDWVDHPCPAGLIWFQERCWCDWNPVRPTGPPAVRRLVGGPDCIPAFNATFNEPEPIDHGALDFDIGRVPWAAVTMENAVPGANGGGAARVRNGQLALWWTGSNDFGNKIQIQFRFKVMDSPNNANSQMVLFSNPQCFGGPKTVEITYRPSDQRYEVFFRDIALADTEGCNMNLAEPYGFHEVDLVFYDYVLSLHVDGEECFTSTKFQNNMRATACYMGLGGSNFDGYIDEATIRRGCRV